MLKRFVIQVSFKALNERSLVCRMKMFFNLNSQGNEEFELLSQGTYDFQNVGNETLFISDYEDIKSSVIQQLAVKLWLKEEKDLRTNDP